MIDFSRVVTVAPSKRGFLVHPKGKLANWEKVARAKWFYYKTDKAWDEVLLNYRLYLTARPDPLDRVANFEPITDGVRDPWKFRQLVVSRCQAYEIPKTMARLAKYADI